MAHTLTIIQLPDKSVAVTGYRYVLSIDIADNRKARLATTNDLVSAIRGGLADEQWVEVDAALAKESVWRSEVSAEVAQNLRWTF